MIIDSESYLFNEVASHRNVLDAVPCWLGRHPPSHPLVILCLGMEDHWFLVVSIGVAGSPRGHLPSNLDNQDD